MAQKETHSSDVTPASKPTLDLSLDSDLIQLRQGENIIVDAGMTDNSYHEALAFNEDVLTIRLNESENPNAPRIIDVGVNGVTEWLNVGVPVKVKRKYIEVLARCRSDSFVTSNQGLENGDTSNLLSRKTAMKHPFSVIHDPSPRGYDWLVEILSAR